MTGKIEVRRGRDGFTSRRLDARGGVVASSERAHRSREAAIAAVRVSGGSPTPAAPPRGDAAASLRAAEQRRVGAVRADEQRRIGLALQSAHETFSSPEFVAALEETARADQQRRDTATVREQVRARIGSALGEESRFGALMASQYEEIITRASGQLSLEGATPPIAATSVPERPSNPAVDFLVAQASAGAQHRLEVADAVVAAQATDRFHQRLPDAGGRS